MTTKVIFPHASSPSSAVGNMVVARFRSGKTIKGATQDFAPNKTQFHIHVAGEASAVNVATEELKAVFFVKTYDGDSTRNDRYSFEEAKGHGRKVRITFYDGETIAGYTMGYDPKKPGFFLVPADNKGNNSRIFIVNAAVDNFEAC